MNHRLLPVLCGSIALGLLACTSQREAPRDGENVAVLVSPGVQFEASVRKVDISGSIGVSQPYQVLMKSLIPGQPMQSVLLRADKTDGIHIRWSGPSQLVVCYTEAHIYGFQNTFVTFDQTTHAVSEVEIILSKQPSASGCV
jgi:hypothetical protein